MAVTISLNETLLPHDETAEEAFERALSAWRTARARVETVDPALLTPESRAHYYRMLARIGLWADARIMGDVEDPSELDACDPAAEGTE